MYQLAIWQLLSRHRIHCSTNVGQSQRVLLQEHGTAPEAHRGALQYSSWVQHMSLSLLNTHVFAHCAQSSRSPHSDLSALEVAAASRNSEHLFYIVQRSRSFLSALASVHDQLGRICSALAPTGIKHGFASTLVLGQVHTCFAGRQEGASADPARCCSSPWLPRTLDCRPQPILSHTCRIGSCQGAL